MGAGGDDTSLDFYNSMATAGSQQVKASNGGSLGDSRVFQGVARKHSSPPSFHSRVPNKIFDRRRTSFADPPPFYTYIQETFTTPQQLYVNPTIGVPQTIPEDTSRDQAPAESIQNPLFRTRRRHAGKLSKFFGVTSHEISEVMATTPTTSVFTQAPSNSLIRANSWTNRRSFSSRNEHHRDLSTPVGSTDVRYDGSTSRWRRFSVHRYSRSGGDNDMEEIMGKLRGMKAGL